MIESGTLAGTTIGIVGAGMMGGAIAYACARAGADVLGIGFPARTGGVVSFTRSYLGGSQRFTARAHELAARYGDRFLPPEPPPQTHDQSEFS